MFPALSRKNTQSENMCDGVFEKVKGRCATVNRRSVHAEAAVRRVLYKRYYEKFSIIHKKTSVPYLFLGFFLLRTPILQNSTGQLLLIIAVSKGGKGIAKQRQ